MKNCAPLAQPCSSIRGILPDSFADAAAHICTLPYIREGTDKFLATFGPAQYHSADEYEKAVGKPLPATSSAAARPACPAEPKSSRPRLRSDPNAEATLLGPRRQVLELYETELDRLHLDGFVYPAIQMPPVDETMPQDGRLSDGPHSATGWVNMLGVPAISIPAGFYDTGLPFGIEISARKLARWRSDLLGLRLRIKDASPQAASAR